MSKSHNQDDEMQSQVDQDMCEYDQQPVAENDQQTVVEITDQTFEQEVQMNQATEDLQVETNEEEVENQV